MDKYYKQDPRDAVRMKTLSVMSEIVRANRHMYEEELLQKIVIPAMKGLDNEPSLDVRLAGISVLTSLCGECSSRECLSLVDVLERVVSKPLEKKQPLSWTDQDHPDVREAIFGLIQIFKTKLCHQQPAAFITKIYGILTKHLEDNYVHVNVFTNAGPIRIEIFRLFLALRSSSTFHLGLVNEESSAEVKYSPYIVCRDHQSSAASSGVTYLSLTRACILVIKSLSEERDWNVMRLILSKVPTVLQNKAIITRYGKGIHLFITPLVELLSK